VTRIISWREIARSNQKRGKQANEHGRNQRRVDEQPFIDFRFKYAAVELNGVYDSIQLTHSQSLRVRGSKWERLREKAGMREDVARIVKIAKGKNLLPSSKRER